MWVPPEVATSPTKTENNPTPVELTLSKYFAAQRAAERKLNPTMKERGQAVRELMGKKERDISGRTASTYAGVLATEFMSLNAARETAARTGQDFDPQGEKAWQASFINNFMQEFAKKNPDFKFGDANRDEVYSACFTAAEDLLHDKDPDKRELWMTNAMVAAKKQMLAIQVATGAEIRVTQEADEIEDVADIHAMSAMLAEESGVPLDQVQEDMTRLQKFFMKAGVKRSRGMYTLNLPTGDALTFQLPSINKTDFLFPLTRAALKKIYNANPGRAIKHADNGQILSMLNDYAAESKKRIHSNIKVDFLNDGEVNYARPYYVGDPADPNNRRQLDAVQIAYLQNLPRIGSVEQGDDLRLLPKREARRLLTSMAAAQQDFMFSKYSVQERTADDFNMVREQNGALVMTGSPEGNIIPRIDGIPPIPVGNNEVHFSLDAQLTYVNEKLAQKVKQEIRDTVGIGQIVVDINTQIADIEAKQATAHDEKKIEEKNQKLSEKAVLLSESEDLEKYKNLDAEIGKIGTEITTLTANAQPGLTIRTEITTAEGELRKLQAEQAKLEAQKTATEQEIQNKKNQIVKIQEKIEKEEADMARLEEDHIRNEAKQRVLEQQIRDLDAALAANPGDRGKQNTRNRLVQEQTDLLTQIAAYAGRKLRIETSIQNLNNSITDTGTGLETQVETLITSLGDESRGLIKSIQDKKNEQITEQTEIDGKKADLEQYAPIIDQLEEKKRKQRELQTQKIKLESDIKLSYNLEPSDYAARQITLVALIDEKDRKIAELTADLDIQTLELDYKREVLQSAAKHILTPDKWNSIKERSRRPLTEITGAAQLGQKDMLTEINLACERNPNVLPAFMRTIGIIGDTEALQNTAEGRQKYREISKVISPELWFTVFKKRNEALLANALYGDITLPRDMTIYDADLQDPDIQRLMFRQIDRRFIDDLMNEVFVRAANKDPSKPQLGVLTADEVAIYKAVATQEKSVSEEVIESERKGYDNAVDKAKISYRWAVDERRRAAVDLVNNYVTGPLGLPIDQAKDVISAVQKVKQTANITTHVISQRDFAPRRAAITAAFQDVGLNVTESQMIGIINTISPLNITEQDMTESYPESPDRVIGAANLDMSMASNIANSVRQYLVDNQLRPPVTDTMLNSTINGTLALDALKLLIERENGGSLPSTFDVDATRQFVKDISLTSQSAESYITMTDDILKDFLIGGGSNRDGIWLSLVLADADIEVAIQVKDALYKLKNQKEERTLTNIIENLPDGYKGLVIDKVQLLKDDAEVLWGAQPGITVNPGDIDNDDIVSDGELASLAGSTLLRSRSWNVDMSRPPNAEIITREAQAFNRLLSPELGRSSLEKDIKRYDQLFWGVTDRDLSIAIEQHLGGESHRNDAIALAREIIKRRNNI